MLLKDGFFDFRKQKHKMAVLVSKILLLYFWIGAGKTSGLQKFKVWMELSDYTQHKRNIIPSYVKSSHSPSHISSSELSCESV